jgi:hypothetical protein
MFGKYLRDILFFLGVFCADDAGAAIYRCEKDGVVSYGEIPCTDGVQKIFKPGMPVDSSRQQMHQQQTQAEKSRLQALRQQRLKQEARLEKEKLARAVKAHKQQQKCEGLRQKLRWAREDARRVTLKNLEASRLQVRRIAEKITLECGADYAR